MNVVYSRTHTSQVHATVRPVDRAPIKAQGVGCLCGLNPHYRKNKSNAWVNEFLVVEYHPGRNYSAHVLTIIDGEVSYSG